MPTGKLTKGAVDRLRPGKAPTFLWDSELRGFGCKVTPKGHKSFVVQFRPGSGGRRATARRLTIGAYGPLTVDAARREARKVLGSVATGSDPAAARSAHRKAETLAEGWPLYLEELHAKKRARTSTEWARLMRREVLPKLGNVRIRDLTRDQVARLHLAMRERPYLANRVVEVIRAFMAWCIDRGLRPDGVNPARGIDTYREQPRERYLTTEELGRLHATLTLAETEGIPPAEKRRRKRRRPRKGPEKAPAQRKLDPVAVAVIRFLALSGFREGEALSLRWDAIDFKRGLATLAETKTGRSSRYLGAPALDVLHGMERYRMGDYVFPGRRPDEHRAEVRRAWDAVRKHAKIEDVRLHDLRHSVAAVAASGGASLPLVGALLGHKSTRATQRYAHLVDAAQAEVAQRTAGDIHAAMTGATTEAAPIRKARKR